MSLLGSEIFKCLLFLRANINLLVTHPCRTFNNHLYAFHDEYILLSFQQIALRIFLEVEKKFIYGPETSIRYLSNEMTNTLSSE